MIQGRSLAAEAVPGTHRPQLISQCSLARSITTVCSFGHNRAPIWGLNHRYSGGAGRCNLQAATAIRTTRGIRSKLESPAGKSSLGC